MSALQRDLLSMKLDKRCNDEIILQFCNNVINELAYVLDKYPNLLEPSEDGKITNA